MFFTQGSGLSEAIKIWCWLSSEQQGAREVRREELLMAVKSHRERGGGPPGLPREVTASVSSVRFHMQTLRIYELVFNQNNNTFTLILLINVVLCGTFLRTRFIKYKCFDMRFARRRCPTRATPWYKSDEGSEPRHRGTSLIRNTSPP